MKNEKSQAKINKSIVGFLLSVLFFDLIGVTLLITVQAFIVEEYNTTALAVSLLVVIYAATQFISAPILGRISDRYGRRPILLICLLGSAIGYFIFGIGGALWVLYFSRFIDGFTGGNISIAQAYIADISSESEKAKNFGLLGAAMGLGLIVGPIFGSIFSTISLTAPAYAAGIFSLVATVLGFFILPESLPKEKRTPGIKLGHLNPLKSISKMLNKPIIGILLIVYSITSFAREGFNVNVPVYLIYKFKVTPTDIGIFLALIGIILAVIQGGLIGRISQKIGDKNTATVGLIFQALGFVLFFLAPSLWMIYLTGILIGAGAALYIPTLTAVLSKNVSLSEQGEVFGVTASLSSLTNVLGPLWAGFVYDLIIPSAPYWMGAIILIIGIILISRTPVRVSNLNPL